jgi:glucose-6-phosphate 1-dehydrogenase
MVESLIANPGRPAPCALVIFGAAGDLTKRLLVPALYNLKRENLLPDTFTLIGIAHHEKSDDAFRQELGDFLKEFESGDLSQDDWDWIAGRTHYICGEFEDAKLYQSLKTRLTEANGTAPPDNYLFYLATPAKLFAPIIHQLGNAGLVKEDGNTWRRVIIEKPFGHDLPSAEALNRDILSVLNETQIYRIDHYLGKETVQNILVFRFASGLFEPLWNRDHIDHVQITVAETVDVEGRGKFYDATGTLRDMVPNHMFQLLTMTAMEPPGRLDADALRTERAKVLDAVRPLSREDVMTRVVRAQYGAGKRGDTPVAPYREAQNVNPQSTTETYVAMKLMVDSWRWAGVPFYMRTGKALAAKKTEIAIRFKQAPLALFRDTPAENVMGNELVLHIQPDEGVALRFGAKVPGPGMHLGPVNMTFKYADYFKSPRATGYETLIYDCMIGDATLFQRADNIEAGWKVVQPMLDAWRTSNDPDLPTYTAGGQGPTCADDLLARDGREWRRIGNGNALP